MRNIFLACAIVLVTAVSAFAQKPMQLVPFNALYPFASAGPLQVASVNIAGIPGKRIFINQILGACDTPGLPGVMPTIIVTDTTSGAVIWSHSHTHYFQIELPNIPDKFSPPLALPDGHSVLIQANVGAACGGFTGLEVAADQF